MSPDKPNARFKHLYAIVRIDIPVDPDHPEDSISVVNVFPSRESAEVETARLNRINAEKHCTYSMHITRMPVIH
jgi:hypothetical protein